MFYRESGQFKSSYAKDQAIFPIRQDQIAIVLILAVAFLVVPWFVNDYWSKSVLQPFLVFSIAAIGLNILVGYCGQISLGTGGFMAVGAYASYKIMTSFPDMPIVLVIILSGFCAAGVGILFGLPSLRIKGFYLAVATLASQFFLIWMFNKVPWFHNYTMSQITVPPREFLGVTVTSSSAGPAAQYLFCLSFVVVGAWLAKNLVRGRTGRSWMAIRDMDIAAELIGIRPLQTKLLAFAISSFYIGISGALIFCVYLGTVEASEAFDINQSFLVLFMIIIGGLGSILGSFLGAGFMILMPIVLKNIMVGSFGMAAVTAKHIEISLMGVLIVFFLIVEPHGFARLWQILKEKLRLWPFPY
jgi:branched-chain amino acid transport system permease protein